MSIKQIFDNSKVLRVLSCTVVISMLWNIFINVQVFAVTSNKYVYDKYTVEYSVVSEWEKHQNIEIKITNISDSAIDNWAFKYNAGGEICNIWNATIIQNKDTEYIIKNSDWNYQIEPNHCVNFGYTLVVDNAIEPCEFELCSQQTDIKDEFDVQVNINNAWDEGASGEFVITNLSNEPIEAWTLTFETNFLIDSLWNGKILYNDGYCYTISSESWNYKIQPNNSVSIGFVCSQITGTQAKISDFSLTSVVINGTFEPATDKSIEIKSTERDFVANSGSETIYFYVATDMDISSISLINVETNEVVATMFDDGKYYDSGDDMMGDGVYSAKYIINTDVSEDKTITFKALINEEVYSEEVLISIFVPFTEQELNDMRYVDEVIEQVLTNNATPDEYNQVSGEFAQNGAEQNNEFNYKESFEQRYNEMILTLENLIVEGKVLCYTYDERNQVFNCKYANEISFFVVIGDILEGIFCDKIEMPFFDGNYDGYNALILNAFEDSEYRTEYYESFVDIWNNKGMNVEYDDDVTVEDLKTCLLNKDIISLSGHGTMWGGESVFCLYDDIVSTEKDDHYFIDLITHRIHKSQFANGINCYIVTSDFFTDYYNDGALDGSFIFSESCMFMGSEEENGYDETFANALIDCSAEAVIGFENSVMADYSRELMLIYFYGLLQGQTASEAFDNAREIVGYNDYEYREPSFWEYLFDRDAFGKMGLTAYPYLIGNGEAKLSKISKEIANNEIINGDWEKFSQLINAKPQNWEYAGDVRVLSKLGEIEPYGEKMAFISTGIGSQSGEDMSGVQGSTLYQTMRNMDKVTIEFNYNVISEEPMEYVGYTFDDKFEIQILDSNGCILYSKILESVNSSMWYNVQGINFDGGDNTVYHTSWKTASIDISKYRNRTITIKFLVYDVGDSQYDTAVVLDNIVCK